MQAAEVTVDVAPSFSFESRVVIEESQRLAESGSQGVFSYNWVCLKLALIKLWLLNACYQWKPSSMGISTGGTMPVQSSLASL